MRSLTITFTVLLFVSTFAGCSRIRQMTRRDYAGMEDPFAERQIQDGAVVDSRSSRTPDSLPRPGLRGDKLDMNADSRIRTAGQSRVVGNDNQKFAGISTAGFSNSASGPSLNDFVSKSEQKLADTRAAAAAFGNQAKAAVTEKTDMLGMTQFLEEQATASGLSETSKELDKDFAEFMSSQKQEWSRKTAAVQEQASPFINAAKSSAQAVSETAEAANPFGATAAETAIPSPFAAKPQQADVATPFIQQASGQRFDSTPQRATPAGFAPSPNITPRSNPAPPTGNVNPFEAMLNDHADIGRGSVGASPQASTPPPAPEWNAAPAAAPLELGAVDPFVGLGDATSARQSIDSGFNFDSGWKPSDLVQQ